MFSPSLKHYPFAHSLVFAFVVVQRERWCYSFPPSFGNSAFIVVFLRTVVLQKFSSETKSFPQLEEEFWNAVNDTISTPECEFYIYKPEEGEDPIQELEQAALYVPTLCIPY